MPWRYLSKLNTGRWQQVFDWPVAYHAAVGMKRTGAEERLA